MVDTYAHVALVSECGAGRPGRPEGVCDPNPLQILRLLPDVHEIRDHAGNANAQPIVQGVHRPGPDAQLPTQVLHIRTQAHAIHGLQIFPEGLIAEVEVVVAQGEVVQAHGVEGGGHRVDGPLSPVLQVVLGQRRSLEGVAAVQHQGVPILFNLSGQIQQTGIFRAVGGIVHREYMAMGI